jgi:hypothetical protein
MNPVSDGLKYTWSPALNLSDPLIRNPLAFPSNTTNYQVQARIGKCLANDDIVIRTIPYPKSNAGADTTVCFQDTAHLNASIVGSSFTWNPTGSLSNANILDPFAYPARTTIYTLLSFDTLGCPKPGIDQIEVKVRQKINAYAGNDTAIVIGQPLQLSGSGAEFFEWVPSTGLNQTKVADPITVLNENITYLMRTYTGEGCFSLDTIHIQVFKTKPDIFVPNAFAPQGVNNILKPKPVGLSSLDYFRVYNRWGQLVFQTAQLGVGWNGRFNGDLQDNGVYVWMVSGKDYTGKRITKKGTAILIR